MLFCRRASIYTVIVLLILRVDALKPLLSFSYNLSPIIFGVSQRIRMELFKKTTVCMISIFYAFIGFSSNQQSKAFPTFELKYICIYQIVRKIDIRDR